MIGLIMLVKIIGQINKFGLNWNVEVLCFRLIRADDKGFMNTIYRYDGFYDNSYG